MPDPHICNHEAEIAIMGSTLRDHHDRLARHEEEIDMLKTANVVNVGAVESINNTLGDLTTTVKGLVKTINEWTGSLKILIWITSIMVTILTGTALSFVGYVLKRL